jgi:hypothetical protein
MQQPVEGWCGARLNIQRMYANRTIDVVITLGQGFNVGSIVSTDTDAQKVPDSALASGIECGIQ